MRFTTSRAATGILVPVTQRNVTVCARCRDDWSVTWTEDGRSACLVDHVVVLRWNDAADDDEDVGATHLLQGVDQLRYESAVSGGQRRDADDVHVGVDGLLSDLFRRLRKL